LFSIANEVKHPALGRATRKQEKTHYLRALAYTCQIFLGRNKILGGKVVITDESMGISQLFGGHAPGLPPPKVYAYVYKYE